MEHQRSFSRNKMLRNVVLGIKIIALTVSKNIHGIFSQWRWRRFSDKYLVFNKQLIRTRKNK